MGLDFLDEYQKQMSPDTGISDDDAQAIKQNVDTSIAAEQNANAKAQGQAAKDQAAQQKAAISQQAQSIKEQGGIVVHDENGLPQQAVAPNGEAVRKTAHSDYVVGSKSKTIYSKDPTSGDYVEAPSDHYVNPSTGLQFKSYGNGVFKQPVLDEQGKQVTDPVFVNKKAYGSMIDDFVNQQKTSMPPVEQKNLAAQSAIKNFTSTQKDFKKNFAGDVPVGFDPNAPDADTTKAEYQQAKAEAQDKLKSAQDARDAALNDSQQAKITKEQIQQQLNEATTHKQILAKTGTLPPDIAKKYGDALTPKQPAAPVDPDQTAQEGGAANVVAGPAAINGIASQSGIVQPQVATLEGTSDLPIDQHKAALEQSNQVLQQKQQEIQTAKAIAIAPLAPIEARQTDWQNRADTLLYGQILPPDADRSQVPILPGAQADTIQTLDGQTITFPKGMKGELQQIWNAHNQAVAKIAPQMAQVQGMEQSFQEDVNNHQASALSLQAKLEAEKTHQEQARQANVAKLRETAPAVADQMEALHTESQKGVGAIQAQYPEGPARDAALQKFSEEQQAKGENLAKQADPISQIKLGQQLFENDQDKDPESVDARRQIEQKAGLSREQSQAMIEQAKTRPYSLDEEGKIEFKSAANKGTPTADELAEGVHKAIADGIVKDDPELTKKVDQAKAEYDKMVAEAGDASKAKAVLRGLGKGGLFLAGAAPGARVGALAGAAIPVAGETGIPEAVGGAAGGLIGGTIAVAGGEKLLDLAGKYSDTVNSINQAAKLNPGYQGAGELASFALAPTRILSKAAWAEGAGEALKPAAVRSLQNYKTLADVAADSAGKAGASAAIDSARSAAAATAILKAGGSATTGAALFTAGQYAFDAGRYAIADRLGISHDELKAPGLSDLATNVGLALLLHGGSLKEKGYAPEEVADLLTRAKFRRDVGVGYATPGKESEVLQAFKDAGVDTDKWSDARKQQMAAPFSKEEVQLYQNAEKKVADLQANGNLSGVDFGGGRQVSMGKTPLASSVDVEGKFGGKGGGLPAPAGGGLPSSGVQTAASDAEIKNLDADTSLRAQTLRDVAAGKSTDELTLAELNSVGLDKKQGSSDIVPYKPPGEKIPVTPSIHVDGEGKATVLQPAIDQLKTVAPATAALIPNESDVRKLPEDQAKLNEAIATHGQGKVKMTMEAVKAFEPLFNGLNVGETRSQSGIEFDPTTGSLHVDPTKLINHIQTTGGGTVAGAKRELTKALFEEKEHRLSTMLDNDPNGNATATTNPEFAKDLNDMWSSVPQETKDAQATSYYKREGAKFPSDWHAKHEWWADTAAALERGEIPHSLDNPHLLPKLKAVIQSYIKALQEWLSKAPAEVKAAYARTVAKLKQLEAKLKSGKVTEAPTAEPPPDYSELQKVYGVADHPSFEGIAKRAKAKEPLVVGGGGKLNEMSRKNFLHPDTGKELPPLAAHPALRKFLGLPEMPPLDISEKSQWSQAAQHTMDALAEKAGIPRSSHLDEASTDKLKDMLGEVKDPTGTLAHSAGQTIAATEVVQKRLDKFLADPNVADAIAKAQAEVNAGKIMTEGSKKSLVKGFKQALRKTFNIANQENFERQPRSNERKDVTRITENALDQFAIDLANNRLSNNPEGWIGHRIAAAKLDPKSGERDSAGDTKAPANEEVEPPGIGFDPHEVSAIETKRKANEAKREEIIAKKKLAEKEGSDKVGGMKPAYREYETYTPEGKEIQEGSPRHSAMVRNTIPQNLVKSADITASAWDKPAYIQKRRETQNQASGDFQVDKAKRDGYVVGATVHPDGKIELESGFYRPNPSVRKTTEPQQPELPSNFAQKVQVAASKVPKEGQFGDQKVFISHLWKEYAKANKDIPTLYGFKKVLLDSFGKGDLLLTRADLVEGMKPEDVKGSEIDHPFANGEKFHFLVKPEVEQPKIIPPPPLPKVETEVKAEPWEMTPEQLTTRNKVLDITYAQKALNAAKSGEEKPNVFSNGAKSKAALIRDRQAALEAAQNKTFNPKQEIWETALQGARKGKAINAKLVEGLPDDLNSGNGIRSIRQQLVDTLTESYGYERKGDSFVKTESPKEPPPTPAQQTRIDALRENIGERQAQRDAIEAGETVEDDDGAPMTIEDVDKVLNPLKKKLSDLTGSKLATAPTSDYPSTEPQDKEGSADNPEDEIRKAAALSDQVVAHNGKSLSMAELGRELGRSDDPEAFAKSLPKAVKADFAEMWGLGASPPAKLLIKAAKSWLRNTSNRFAEDDAMLERNRNAYKNDADEAFAHYVATGDMARAKLALAQEGKKYGLAQNQLGEVAKKDAAGKLIPLSERFGGDRLGAAPSGAPDPVDVALQQLQLNTPSPQVKALLSQYHQTGKPTNLTQQLHMLGVNSVNAGRAQTILNHARGNVASGGAGNPPPPTRPPPAAAPFGKIFTAGKAALGDAQVVERRAQIALAHKMDDFRKAVPRTYQREAITLFNQADGNVATLKSWESIPKLAGIAKRAQVLTPVEKQWAADTKAHTTIDPTDNMHLWKKPFQPHKQDELAKQEELGNFKTFADALSAKFRPKQLDAADVYTTNASREISDTKKESLKDAWQKTPARDSAPLLVPQSKSDYRYRNVAGLEGYGVHREVAKEANAVFGHSKVREILDSSSTGYTAEVSKRIVKTAEALNNAIRSGGFMYSLFHPVQLATQALGHLTNPLGKIENLDLKNSALHIDGVKHGLNVGHTAQRAADDFLTGISSSGGVLGEVLRKSHIESVGATGDFFKKYSIAGAMNRFTSHVVDHLKLSAYENVSARNLKAFANDIRSGKMTEGDVKYISAQQVNNSFGHLNYEQMGRGLTSRHLASFFGLSPDFLEARLRHAGQAVQGAVGLAGTAVTGGKSETANFWRKAGQEQLLGLAVIASGMFVASRIANALLNNGDTHMEHPFDVISGNRKYGLRNVAEDAVRMVQDPMRFAKARLSPVGAFMLEAITGSDWRGNDSTLAETAKRTLGKAVPLPLQAIPGVKEQVDPTNKLSMKEQLASASGLQIKADSAMYPAYDVVDKFKNGSLLHPVTKHYPVSQFSQLKDALEGNNTAKAKAEITKLRESHKPEEIAKGLKASIFHRWVGENEQAAFDKFVKDNDYAPTMYKANQMRQSMWSRFNSLYPTSVSPAVPQYKVKAMATAYKQRLTGAIK